MIPNLDFIKTLVNGLWFKIRRLVTSVNGQTGDVKLTAKEVGALPDTFSETDPTVPNWAKQATKPTYTAKEVGALPDTTKIPSKTSELTNDSGFLASKPSYTVSEIEGAAPTADPVFTGSISMGRLYGSTVGVNSVATGTRTIASGTSSHAEGMDTTARGIYSHAEGVDTDAYGSYAHAEGYHTVAFGLSSHAEGSASIEEVVVSVESSDLRWLTLKVPFSLRYGDIISYNDIFSCVWITKVDGDEVYCSNILVDEPIGEITVLRYRGGASGDQAHSEGADTLAAGDRSHAEGYKTRADGENQHVQGALNTFHDSERSKYAHIVGNGTETQNDAGETVENRSNAHTLDWDGNAWFAGDVYVGSTSGTDRDEGSKKLATEEYVNSVAMGGVEVPVYDVATPEADGLMSKEDKTKLDGLSAYEAATPEADGLMSSEDKTKLDGLSAYEAATPEADGLMSKEDKAKLDGLSAYEAATPEADGLMSKEDKAKLDGLGGSSGGSSGGSGVGAAGTGDNAEVFNGGAAENASGLCSHAEGMITLAKGMFSHAEGEGTIAASRAQHAEGSYNIEDANDKYIHIVGNGLGSSFRSNAHTLDWDGNAWFAGSVEGTALILTSPGGKRFEITVDDDGTLQSAEVTSS